MPGTIPNMRSTAQIPSNGTKRKRFIGTGASVIAGVLTGNRQKRTATNLDPMRSVAGAASASTAQRDAQAAVYETASPGSRLHV